MSRIAYIYEIEGRKKANPLSRWICSEESFPTEDERYAYYTAAKWAQDYPHLEYRVIVSLKQRDSESEWFTSDSAGHAQEAKS